MAKTNLKKIFIFLNITISAGIARAAELEINNKNNQTSSKQVYALPAIRRIGIAAVETNIDEFRNFMREQDRLLSGIVAFPFNEQDIKKLLADDLEKETANTGRFWDLSFSQFIKINPDQIKNKNEENKTLITLQNKLEKSYDLDAWIKPKIIFSPDQTLVRITLKGINNNPKNWAREDILIEPQPSEEKIKIAFAEALSRIITTIGHDGKVTYIRDNLASIDFGSERGLKKGDKIFSGYVLLKSFFPQSGEFLRSERVPIYELKVLEARQGSSLCEIVAADKIKQEQIPSLFDIKTVNMLAWREKNQQKNNGWHEPYDPQTAPILGATESGFGTPLQKKEIPLLPKNMKDPSQNQTKLVSILPPQQATQVSNEVLAEDENNLVNNADKEGFKKHALWNQPKTWNLKDFQVGLGITLGSIAEGEASSFPSTLLNRFTSSAFYKIDNKNELYFSPHAQFVFFDGNGIAGDSYALGGTIYNLALPDAMQKQNLYIGGDVQITGRQVKGLKSTRDLSNLQIGPSIKWDSALSGFGEYAVEASFSALDLIQLQSVWAFKTEFQPYEIMTKQLSFDIGFKRYVNNWIEFSIGINWNFISRDSL
jgi:hypothetical protein